MDAKSLLRAKKASSERIEHPHASYSASGQLRCAVCAAPVTQWDAHVLTKQHRQAVVREKKEAEAAVRKKRHAEGAGGTPAKRARTQSQPAAEGTGADEGEGDARPALPEGFFSAGNGPSAAANEDEDEDEAGPSTTTAKTAGGGDEELDAFLASLNDDEDGAGASAAPPTAAGQAAASGAGGKRRRAAYKDTTGDEGVASYSAAPQLVKPGDEGRDAAPADEAEQAPEETEAERRARVAREDKEEIMARLEEEQRAQEDADARVTALRARMDALKKRRAARANGPVSTAAGGPTGAAQE